MLTVTIPLFQSFSAPVQLSCLISIVDCNDSALLSFSTPMQFSCLISICDIVLWERDWSMPVMTRRHLSRTWTAGSEILFLWTDSGRYSSTHLKSFDLSHSKSHRRYLSKIQPWIHFLWIEAVSFVIASCVIVNMHTISSCCSQGWECPSHELRCSTSVRFLYTHRRK